ncbi:hypothetical protein [Brachyspira hyodysenteriae]|uniref:hypothetical protein n=1 Tax=Brachyspira hyodysenteriae TaxID=159 RepID=UPI0022CD9529|nr:hypothetical protein [Brachyspira hyodysenteriae]MCZ9966169.1 hypothetical protein [Brachyspira hyodysenteriae]
MNTNDIEIVKVINGYQLFKEKAERIWIQNTIKKTKTDLILYLYIDNNGDTNSIVRIRERIIIINFGKYLKYHSAKCIFRLEEIIILHSLLRDIITLLLEAYNINNETLINNEIILKANNAEISTPTITLRNVEKEGDLYAFYLYYSGGDNGEYAFYVREGRTNTSYKLTDASYGNTGSYDSSGIVYRRYF